MGKPMIGSLQITKEQWDDGWLFLEELVRGFRDHPTQRNHASKVLVFAQLWADEKFAEENA